MKLLLTNDDGYAAPGLLILKHALEKVGRVVVVAPDQNWSAGGHVKTMHKPLRLTQVQLVDGAEAYASSGAPSDCVALVLLGAIDFKPDMIVSGINSGPNLGHDVTYSGTVTAAMEAAISGLTAVAVSLDSPENFSGLLDYEPSAMVGKKVAEMVMQNGLPANTLLNVNIPYLPLDEMKGFCITRQGLRIYRDELVRRLDPRGRPYYWIGGDTPTGVPEDDTDFGALKEGYVSITPLQLDLTAHDQLAHLREWSWPKL